MDGDAVDQTALEPAHVLGRLAHRRLDAHSHLHVEHDRAGGAAPYRHLAGAGASTGAVARIGVHAGADDGRIAEPSGIFPTPARGADAAADRAARILRQEGRGIAADLGIDGVAAELDERRVRPAFLSRSGTSLSYQARHTRSESGMRLSPASAPISRAKRAAPAPTRRTCGSFSITARATAIGWRKP